MHRRCGSASTSVAYFLVAMLILGGCTSLAPKYSAPDADFPTGYDNVAARDTSATLPTANAYYTDPALQRLIEQALVRNHDLRISALDAKAAFAAFGIEKANELPTIGATASGTLIGSSEGSPMLDGRKPELKMRSVGVGVSAWELDLWGRVRNLKTAALETYLATDAGQKAMTTALIAQVAAGYYGLREIDARLVLAKAALATRAESYRIFKRRYEVGSTSKLELTQVEILLHQAQSLCVELEQSRELQVHALDLLVGGKTNFVAVSNKDEPALPEVAPGLPSSLLLNRPDIVAAEHMLRASNARIGAARAAFLPRITLTGSLGYGTTELEGLFDSTGATWQFNPSLTLPIFDWGRKRNSLDLAEVRKEQSVVTYEKTVQAAFRDVADALTLRRSLGEQVDIAAAAHAALAERARLARLRYDNGATTFLEVLDAERDLLTAQQQLVHARYGLTAAHIRLYAALGGGADAQSSSSKEQAS